MDLDLTAVPDVVITHLEPGHFYILTLPDFCTAQDMAKFMSSVQRALRGVDNPPVLMISTHSAEVQHMF